MTGARVQGCATRVSWLMYVARYGLARLFMG